MKRFLIAFLIVLIFAPVAISNQKNTTLSHHVPIKVLILSGRNNHEWKKTTPILNRIFTDTKNFITVVTEKPDTLTYATLKNFRLVISNWNSWPDNNIRIGDKWEKDFEKFVNSGGGLLSFHAGASSFYDWSFYHQAGIGRWGKETHHGARTKGYVYGMDQTHPISKGMAPFFIMDEIWEKSDIVAGAKAIGSLSANDEKDGHQIVTPCVFVNQVGKGRCFFTTLGHDERALLNSGLQTLLLRAAQWCAGQKVTINIAPELGYADKRLPDKFLFEKTDTSFALKNNSEVIWQYNYKNRFGKPYFHPLTIGRSNLTCVSPPDHPWHLGLWFSWKFINGINYWEYQKNFSSTETGFKSDGVTSIEKIKFSGNKDFSADVRLNLMYHPIDGREVMSEERTFHISSQSPDGSYSIDEEHLFTALLDSVLLDRTPIIGEPGGQSWGGYSGLSVRFNQSLTSTEIITPGDSSGRQKSPWVYMGFNSLTGKRAGMMINNQPGFTPKSSSWYIINDPQVPFYYYSPAVIFDKNILLKKGETLRLKYRIWMLGGEVSKEQLGQKYNHYLNNIQ